MQAHLVLIDAMNLIRRIYAAQERPYAMLDQLSENTISQIIHNTKVHTSNALQRILTQHQPSHALAVFDCQGECWRHKLFSDYKKGRKKMPTHLANSLVDMQDGFLAHGVDSLESEHDEADDLIATLAVKMALRGQNTTIISTDKGFLPLLGPHIKVYDYFNKRYIDEAAVRSKFNVSTAQLVDYWTLTGDATNKIPGVSGIGPITAVDLLAKYGSLTSILSANDLKITLRKALQEHEMEIKLYQQLLTLKKDIPLGFNLKDIRLPHTSAQLSTTATQEG
ncbi:flap endonuclease Xni [Thalassotalea ponticola]|uniref:flap endonuclease Xni n=1 Tax=Thalassotalea ponticola TaxID=1523392 RepID=UPI0025B4A901|nr:flap endonuclease Xni [Thalassotalea ponticola]MDN3652591.1 flap endonuclease Xni [Thalassotalea ponticola]